MATVNYLTREVELAVQEEATYGTSPGAVAGADMFKHTSRLHITPKRARYYRDQDADYQQASVLSPAQKGRESSDLKIDVDAIPSGAGTPTEPDIDVLLKVHFGTRLKATAHTTTAAGSTGVTLNLTAGGGAASGIQAGGGDLIAVDVDATYGYEVRRVVSRATDVVTMDRALSANPAVSRAVKVGTTYKFLNSAALSAYIMQWIAGAGVRHAVPGVIITDLDASCAFDNETPMPKFSFSGRGMKEITHAVARPTPVTAGQPLVASQGKAWIGTARVCPINASVKSNNGLELRENQCNSLEPTGAKRTANNSRYSVEVTLESLLSTGDVDTAAIYELAKASDAAPLDLLVQWGITPGTIVAFCAPKVVCDPERTEMSGEFGVKLAGKALGTTGDDELFLAFI